MLALGLLVGLLLVAVLAVWLWPRSTITQATARDARQAIQEIERRAIHELVATEQIARLDRPSLRQTSTRSSRP